MADLREECRDMQDRVGIEHAIRHGLSWSVPATPRTQERKAFDEAVEKWETQQKLEERNAGSAKAHTRRALPMSRRMGVFVAWKGQ